MSSINNFNHDGGPQVHDLIDHYQITNHIAQGGMSDIYKALDLLSGQEVAIKIPDKYLISDPAQYLRFQCEMEIVRTLSHPAILKWLSSGMYNRIPYLVTEYFIGNSLREIINKGRMDLELAIGLTKKIAGGLAYCHDRGILHRDIKPENIIVSDSNQPVIMDFGLAVSKSALPVPYSNLSARMGTPDYMAPEQIKGLRGDARTDIYALGTVLFEMLAGELPYNGENQLKVLKMHLNKNAPQLNKKHDLLPAPYTAIVAKCLERNPDNRYQDMRSLICDLENPENVELSILESKDDKPEELELFKTIFFIGVGISILLFVTGLAIYLQYSMIR